MDESLVELAMDVARKEWPEEFGSAAPRVKTPTVLPFPAKVQRQAKRRMNRVEVEASYRWTLRNRDRWETEATGGAEPAEAMSPRQRQLMKLMDERFGAVKGPTMARMRRDISEGRKLIEKRNAAKAWLASLGADLKSLKDAEQALFFAFDKLA